MRNTFLFVAMTIVMAHALVAHTHIPIDNSAEHTSLHQEAKSLVDFLELGFHHIGNGDVMETYQMPDETNPELSNLQLAFVLRVVLNFQPEADNSPEPIGLSDKKVPSLVLSSALSRRGPPSQLV